MQTLSSLEVQILQCLAAGMQSKEIAAVIDRRKPTVEGYIRTLYVKLDAKSRAHLVTQAYARGILDPKDCQHTQTA